MIAIVILGVGLLVVATMFPIAWTKARDLTENTTANTCTDNALANVQLVTRVSRLTDIPPPAATVSSFFGDETDDGTGTNTVPADPWVHALHMQNLIIDAPVTPGPSPPPPLYGDFADPAVGPLNSDYYLNPNTVAPSPAVIPYQIAFQDRVSPPLPNPAGLTGPALARWKELLRQRRFCWAVLHKLEYDPLAIPPETPTAADERRFTMYFVTLRRGQSTHRFARQDPTDPANLPAYVDPTDSTTIAGTLDPAPVAPQALAAAQDAALPVPWRVQIEVQVTPGLPTEALTNLAGNTNRLVTEMMPTGSWLIDERNGLIYRVAKRDIDPANPDEAILTLDQEIPTEMLDDDRSNPTTPDPPELIRTVWVFPPAVEKERGSDNLPIFIGPQPVVDIQCHVVTYWP